LFVGPEELYGCTSPSIPSDPATTAPLA